MEIDLRMHSEKTMAVPKPEKTRWKDGFRRNVSVLAGGSVIAQLIVFIASPIITRLYTPEQFGTLAAFLSVATPLAIVSTLSYEFAALLPDNDVDAINLIGLALGAAVLFSALIGIAVLLLGGRIAAALDHAALANWLILLPPMVVLLSVQQSLKMWWNRLQRYKLNAVTGIAQAIVDNAVKINAALWTGAGSKGLLAGFIVGLIAADTISVTKVRFIGKHGIVWLLSTTKMAVLARKYIGFPLYNCWAELLCCFYLNLPTLLLALVYDAQVAGLYAIANRVLKTPARIVGLSVSQVLLNEVSQRRNRRLPVYPLVSKVFGQVLVFIAIPLVVGVTMSQNLFGALLGSQWTQAGHYAAAMMPWIGMQLVAVAVSSVYPATEKSKTYTMVQVLRVLAVVCPLMVSHYAGHTAIDGLWMLSATNFVANLVFALIPLYLARQYDAANPIPVAGPHLLQHPAGKTSTIAPSF